MATLRRRFMEGGVHAGSPTAPPARIRLRGLAPAGLPSAGPRELGCTAPAFRAPGGSDPFPSRRARGERDLLPARDDREELPGTRGRGREPRSRDRLPRLLARAGFPADAERVLPGRPSSSLDHRRADRPAAGRLPGADLLHYARHALGLRRSRRAWLRVGLVSSRFASHREEARRDPGNSMPPADGRGARALGVPDRSVDGPGLDRAARRRELLAGVSVAAARARPGSSVRRGFRRRALLPPVRVRPRAASRRAIRAGSPGAATPRPAEDHASQSVSRQNSTRPPPAQPGFPTDEL